MSDTTIMDYGDYDIMLPPSMYAQWSEMNNIFAVPKDNMVGTNDLDNAIKLLEFKTDEDLKQHIVRKDFIEEVTGAYYFRFMPIWSKNEIAYAQSKGFLIVNIPEQKVEIHTISPGIYTGNIENLAILDPEKRVFVLEIDEPNAEVDGFDKILKVIRFENNTFTVLAEHPAGVKTGVYTEPWFFYQKKIFIYNDSTTKIEVYDENFKPTNHQLAEVFNRNQVGFRCMKEIAIHPTLPFALIVERGKPATKEQLAAARALPAPADEKAVDVIYAEVKRRTLYLFRWNEPDEKKQMVPLISIAGSFWKSYNPADRYSHLTFSPDGKWLVFRDGTMRGTNADSERNPVFVAVSIDAKNPLLLGKPVKLGYAMRDGALEPKSTAWTTNPTAFIMCDGLVLYRWNLERYRQPNAQKVKMPPGATDPFMK
ncbi:MAG: hypothetical protein JW915_14660 [Chitinispirillaceae bacterium]|nr:hypothetical protein [Chitinispirillaceae bacterium]